MGDSQIAPIVFSGSEDKSVTELGGAMPLVKNAIPDASGALRRRPGANSTYFSGSVFGDVQIIGLGAFQDWLIVVTSERRIWAVNVQRVTGGFPDLSSLVTLTADAFPDSFLAGTGRPSIVATRSKVFIAGGAQVQVWDGVAVRSSRLVNAGDGVDPVPAYPPPDATFLSAIAQRLVVSVPGSSGQIHWSGPLEGYTNWDYALGGAGYIQAAAKPDPIVAIFDNTNEVFAFGNETIQVFTPAALQVDVNDPNVLLDFAPSRTLNIGTISPYSIVPVDDNFMMLDRQRRFILTDARTYTDVSGPVAQILHDLTSIDDCWGFRMRFGRFDCVVWFFPTDGFGLIYDKNTSKWSEWSYSTRFDGGDAEVVTSAYNWAEKSVFLAGSSRGNLLLLSDTANYDGSSGPGSSPISVEVMTGFTDHGTTSQKHCKTVLLKFKRTTRKYPDSQLDYDGNGSGHVRISKRDNEGAWKIVRDIELGGPGGDPHAVSDVAPANPCIQLRSVGVYRTRHWKIEYTGQDEIQLVSAQEEFEVLGA